MHTIQFRTPMFRMPRILAIHAFLALLSITCLNSAAWGDAEKQHPSAANFVEGIMESLVSYINKHQRISDKDPSARVKLIEEHLAPHFNMNKMVELMMGGHWQSASIEQRKHILKEFKDLMLNSYAGTLLPYLIEVPQIQASKKTTDVKSTLKLTMKNKHHEILTTLLKLEKPQAEWKIIDIKIEGVSLVTSYKGQFSNEIKKSGIDGLIQFLMSENKKRSIKH